MQRCRRGHDGGDRGPPVDDVTAARVPHPRGQKETTAISTEVGAGRASAPRIFGGDPFPPRSGSLSGGRRGATGRFARLAPLLQLLRTARGLATPVSNLSLAGRLGYRAGLDLWPVGKRRTDARVPFQPGRFRALKLSLEGLVAVDFFPRSVYTRFRYSARRVSGSLLVGGLVLAQFTAEWQSKCRFGEPQGRIGRTCRGLRG